MKMHVTAEVIVVKFFKVKIETDVEIDSGDFKEVYKQVGDLAIASKDIIPMDDIKSQIDDIRLIRVEDVGYNLDDKLDDQFTQNRELRKEIIP